MSHEGSDNTVVSICYRSAAVQQAPANLAPSAATFDRACQWGANSVERVIPVTTALLESTWW
jgi:hypothetical protein